MTQASVVLDRASIVLLDKTKKRWDDEELLLWLDDGQKEAVSLRPSAYVITGNVDLVAGTKQALPEGSIQLMDATRNMGTGGSTPGRVVRMVKRAELDAVNPLWHAEKPNAVVRHVAYDPKTPMVFYVDPPQPASNQGKIEVARAVCPPELTAPEDDLALADIYIPALMNYVLYRAFAKDSEYADANAAADFRKAFIEVLTGRESASNRLAPGAVSKQ